MDPDLALLLHRSDLPAALRGLTATPSGGSTTQVTNQNGLEGGGYHPFTTAGTYTFAVTTTCSWKVVVGTAGMQTISTAPPRDVGPVPTTAWWSAADPDVTGRRSPDAGAERARRPGYRPGSEVAGAVQPDQGVGRERRAPRCPGTGKANSGNFGLAVARYRVVEWTGSLSNSGMTLVPKTSSISRTSSCSTESDGRPKTSWSAADVLVAGQLLGHLVGLAAEQPAAFDQPVEALLVAHPGMVSGQVGA